MKPVRIQPLKHAYHQLSQLLLEALLSLYAVSSRQDEKEALQKTKSVLSVYERHMAKEEATLFSILHEYEPCVGATLLTNHRTARKYITSLRNIMAASVKQTDDNFGQSSSQLIYVFNQFLNICLMQMKEHQSIIHPVLWRYYSDEELELMSPEFAISKKVYALTKSVFIV